MQVQTDQRNAYVKLVFDGFFEVVPIKVKTVGKNIIFRCNYTTKVETTFLSATLRWWGNQRIFRERQYLKKGDTLHLVFKESV